MKQKNLLLKVIGLCSFLGFISCSAEDKSVFGDDFEIPELTDANTIQFTVDASGEWKQIEIIGSGGRMAVEWGDGRLQKVAEPEATPIRYKYGNSKTYRVRIWAEELEACMAGDVLIPVSNLRLGYFPKMKALNLNSFIGTPELDLSTSCPNIESINIGNWADLERVDLSQCQQLQRIDLYTHPKLTLLKLGEFPKLTSFNCHSNDVLSSLSLKGATALREIQCGYNPHLSTIEVDDEMKVKSLSIGGCAFQSLDFLSAFPALNSLECSFNQLTELDLSSHSSLEALSCGNNSGLTSLQLPPNSFVRFIDCSFCNLDKNALESIFNALRTAPEPVRPGQGSPCVIYYNGNRGANECDETILHEKKWAIETRPEQQNF